MRTVSLAAWLLKRKSRKVDKEGLKIVGMPYISKGYLLSMAEREFYFILCHVAASRFDIFAKVRIADIIEVEEGVVMRKEYLFRITNKHIDFLLCTKGAVTPVLAIELDDSSHYRSDRYDRDIFVDEVFRRAGIKLLRIVARKEYDSFSLSNDIERILDGPQKPF